MGKNPAFQFYTGDWIQDTRGLSLSAKGAWIDILCYLHRSLKRGEMEASITGWARLMNAGIEQAKAIIQELVDVHVCDIVVDPHPHQSNDIKMPRECVTETTIKLLDETDCHTKITIINRRMSQERLSQENNRLRQQEYRNNKKVTQMSQAVNKKVTSYSSSSSSKTFLSDSKEIGLSALLFSLIRIRNPSFKEPNLQVWAKHIDLIIRADKREPSEIENVIRWCQKDTFWQNNILSTDKLRKQYDQLKMKMNSNMQPNKNEPALALPEWL